MWCGVRGTLIITQKEERGGNWFGLPAAAHAEVACTAFAVILMTTMKSTASANLIPGNWYSSTAV